MEVVSHKPDSNSTTEKLATNENEFTDHITSSPIIINESEDSAESSLSSKLAKFKRVFPSANNEVVSDDSSSIRELPESKNSKDNTSVVTPNSCISKSPTISNDDPLGTKEQNEIPRNINTSQEPANEKKNSTIEESSEEPSSSTTREDQDKDSGGLKIQMVTSLDCSDVFVEAPSGPMSPVLTMSNPLESDKEETGDSVISDNAKVSEKCSEPTSKDSASTSKEQEQEEVITGDKTISSEFVKTNLETLHDKDHGYTKKTNGTENQTKDVQGKKVYKVIYPKQKFTDAAQLKVNKLQIPASKTCFHCSKLAKCDIYINIGGSECFLCSEECLKLHKTEQMNALQRKNCTTVPSTEQHDSAMESRLCVNCDTNVSILPEDKILSWETMEFCNEDCLGKYQAKMWSFCTACKKDVPTASMGKYCVRFGHEVKQFCSGVCLEEFKKGIKVCCYCQKDLSENEEGFLAPIGEKGQFRDFCSQMCLDEYFCMSNNIPGGGLKVEPCGVCDKPQLIQVQVITSPNTTVNLCSLVCLAAFKFVNSAVSTGPCYMCKKYFDKTLPNCITVYYENELLTFCSKACMNINILAKRKIVACNWCKVKKYNFDMIRRKSNTGLITNWCSVNCMALYQVSINVIATNKSRMPCTYCKKLEVPSLHLTMSDATVRNFCSMDCVTAFQTSYPSSTQANGSSTPDNVPIIQSVTSLKKPGEIKVISPASMNGGMQAALMSPLSQPSVIQPSPQQIIKHQILVVPQARPAMANAKVQTRPFSISKAVTVRINKSTKYSQTDKEEDKGPVLIPVPVPIYIPCPMAMYSVPVPTPLPIPIPIPVPIIIPTTKGSAEEILEDIKRIQEQTPGNPYEAELLMMAQLAENQKATGEETNKDDRRSSQKRPACDLLDEDPGPPDKKRKEDIEVNSLGSTVHHLVVSRLPMSLKETLGVSAWKHFSAESGDSTELLEMRPGVLAQALKNFIKNAKIPGGGHYTPDQKYYLMLGIQCYLLENSRLDNIFYDKLMEPFIESLDEDAKSFQSMFAPGDNIITRVEEEHLWESKQLGPHSPYTLLSTLIYFNTKFFNLTTVEEHMQLSFKDIVKHYWKRNLSAPEQPSTNSSTTNMLLRYITPESVLESNPKKKKVYEQEPNVDDAYRCPIHLYEFYLSKCPESVKNRNDIFYLSPERSCVPDSPIWYSTLPLAEEVVVRTLNRFRMVKEINLAILSSS